MKLNEFNFDLPEDRIARFPSEQRDGSRLMIVNRQNGEISHHRFGDILEFTDANDFFVVNNSRVIPVRLFGKIDDKTVEMLIVKPLTDTEAEVLTLPAKRFKLSTIVTIDKENKIEAEVIETGYRGRRRLRFNTSLKNVLSSGFAPLPPYIKRKYEDAIKYRTMDIERYQTIYSQIPGSIAAPTAGLHFTPTILNELKKRSEIIEITLNVGETTFQKIEVNDITAHRMGREQILIKNNDLNRILNLKKNKHLIAVGTTSVRSLETWALLQPETESFISEIFIYPGFQFKMTDKLITNFHLPESSLFILVSAFAGLGLMKEAYAEAIRVGYRFFSYGDSMFII